jgi:hypothetical protein
LITNTVKTPILNLLWGTSKNDIKSRKHYFYGHLNRVIQKVCKIAENVKCGNVKSGFAVHGNMQQY